MSKESALRMAAIRRTNESIHEQICELQKEGDMENETAKHTPAQILIAVRTEAFAFGRCCDLYQDKFGTFHCHQCGQRTFSMLQGVQKILGDGSQVKMDHDESVRSALIRSAAPELLAACKMLIATADSADESGNTEAEVIAANWDVIGPVCRAATAKAERDADTGDQK